MKEPCLKCRLSSLKDMIPITTEDVEDCMLQIRLTWFRFLVVLTFHISISSLRDEVYLLRARQYIFLATHIFGLTCGCVSQTNWHNGALLLPFLLFWFLHRLWECDKINRGFPTGPNMRFSERQKSGNSGTQIPIFPSLVLRTYVLSRVAVRPKGVCTYVLRVYARTTIGGLDVPP